MSPRQLLNGMVAKQAWHDCCAEETTAEYDRVRTESDSVPLGARNCLAALQADIRRGRRLRQRASLVKAPEAVTTTWVFQLSRKALFHSPDAVRTSSRHAASATTIRSPRRSRELRMRTDVLDVANSTQLSDAPELALLFRQASPD